MKHERTSSTPQKKWHEERRRTVRVPVDKIVAYTTHGSTPIIARVTELSNSSFKIVAGEPIAVGTRITIAFPAGALLSKEAGERLHVFEGRIVHASTRGTQYCFGVDLFENAENGADLRWTILQLSLRRTATGLKTRAETRR